LALAAFCSSCAVRAGEGVSDAASGDSAANGGNGPDSVGRLNTVTNGPDAAGAAAAAADVGDAAGADDDAVGGCAGEGGFDVAKGARGLEGVLVLSRPRANSFSAPVNTEHLLTVILSPTNTGGSCSSLPPFNTRFCLRLIEFFLNERLRLLRLLDVFLDERRLRLFNVFLDERLRVLDVCLDERLRLLRVLDVCLDDRLRV